MQMKCWRFEFLRSDFTVHGGNPISLIPVFLISLCVVKAAKYVSVFNIGIQNTFVYRWNYFLRALFGLIPLAGTVFLWSAVFKERGGGLHGYDYSSMIYYYLLIILVSNLVVPSEDEWQIAADIREGQINALLTKPMSYLAYRFSIFLSGRLVYTFVTLPPIALLFLYFRHYVVLPTDPLVYVLTMVSILMAAFIQFFITYSLAMFAFWILEISTIVFIVYSFEYFLGGQMFPIDIMPTSVQAVMKWLPFYYELFCPVAIFLGRLKGADLVQALAIQTVWLLLAWMWARFMWQRGLGHYQAVGG
jgi:ABC-2 type transport system permease protein